MKISCAARVDIGPLESNDDRVLVCNMIVDRTGFSAETELPAVAVVCDGCGGYDGGYVAAQTVLEFISYEEPEALTDEIYLAQVLRNCQRVLEEKKTEMPHYSKMCTTIAGCVFSENKTVVFHAGDSRVYRFDRWGLARMTVDHSKVQAMVDSGEITAEEAAVHPERNVISRGLGRACPPPDIYTSNVGISSGEKYLFCSDGLWEAVKDSQIEQVLGSNMTLQEMADFLVEKAIAQGADDNISVCICCAQGSAEATAETDFVLD